MNTFVKKIGFWLMSLIVTFAGARAFAAEGDLVEVLTNGVSQGKYATLFDARKALKGGETIKLLGDINEGLAVPSLNLTLDLNGYTLTGGIIWDTDRGKPTDKGKRGALLISANANVTIKDSSESGSGRFLSAGDHADPTADHPAIVIAGKNVSLTIDGGYFYSPSKYDNPYDYAIVDLNGDMYTDPDPALAVTVNGGVFDTEEYPVLNMNGDVGFDGDGCTAVVTGGDFSGSAGLFSVYEGAYDTDADITITGGTYADVEKAAVEANMPQEYEKEGLDYVAEDNGDGTFTVRALNYYWTIVSGEGGSVTNHYETLAGAVAAAADGATITLIKSCETNVAVAIAKSLTIDFKDFAYTSTGAFELTDGTVVLTNGTLTALVENTGATLTIAAGATLSGATALKVTSGTTTLNGGAITGGIALNGGDLYFKSAYEGDIDATKIGTGLVKKDKEVSVSADKDGKYFWEDGETFNQLNWFAD